MKTLLAILLSFIVTEAPVFALHGGYTLGGSASVVGTYAGVLIPTSSTIIASGTAQTGVTGDFGSDSLGIFTVGVPDTGIGAGTLVVFSGNNQLVGTVQALPDPNSNGGIVGVVQASDFVNNFTQPTTTNPNVILVANAAAQTLVAQAGGSFTASVISSVISNSPNGLNLSGSSVLTFAAPAQSTTTTTGSTSSTTTNAALIPYEVVNFAVSGFQQSSADTITSGS